MLRPAGKLGETIQFVTTPVKLNVTGVIAVSLTYVNGPGEEIARSVTSAGFTAKVTLAVVDPAALVNVIV